MARKKPFKADICKINTRSIRALDEDALNAALYKIPPNNSKTTRATRLLRDFLSALYDAATIKEMPQASWDAIRRRGDDETKYATAQALRDRNQRFAQHIEREIHDAQAKAKCKIPAYEAVARDAWREGRITEAVELRKQRRPYGKTPHKRPAKIS